MNIMMILSSECLFGTSSCLCSCVLEIKQRKNALTNVQRERERERVERGRTNEGRGTE